MFIARVDELIPAMSGVLLIRLNMFAERIADELFAELKTRLKQPWASIQSLNCISHAAARDCAKRLKRVLGTTKLAARRSSNAL